MKKILTITLLCLSFILNAQTITYTSSSENITNHEKGWYKYSTGKSSGTFNALTTSQLVSWKNNDKITLVWRAYYLSAFRTSAISSSFLTKIQTDLNTVRNSNTGIKLIIRFAYSDDNNDATKVRILAHIEQLKPIMIANQDVISSFEAGFIGGYGEWYNSKNFGKSNLTTTQYNNRKEVAVAIQTMSPNRKVAYRTPKIIQKNAIPNNLNVGFHNDCFLSDATDYGTMYSSADYTYISNLTQNSVSGGEVCNLSSYSQCSNAISVMNQLHWNYLNIDYNQEVLNYWKTYGCYNEIVNRLGYRFELVNSNITNNVLTINIKNTGFGNLFNERKAFIVYSNITTGQSYSYQLNTDTKNWKSGTTITITEQLKQTLPNGSYKLYLELPDSLLTTKPSYSIQCANIGTWNSTKGWNDLQRTISINNSIINIVNKVKVDVYDLYGTHISNDFDSITTKGIYIIKTNSDGYIETVKRYRE